MANETLYALFQTVFDSERAIGALIDHGIPSRNIGVVARRPAEQIEEDRVRASYVRDSAGMDELPDETIVTYEPAPGAQPPTVIASTITPTSTADTPENVDTVGKEGITPTTPQDAAAGAAVGTSVGLVAGLLAAAAALTVPGVGIVLAGGALASAIGAAVATTAAGAAVGGVAGYLRDMGMPEHAVGNYADRIHEGDYLVAVTIDTAQHDDVDRILRKYNAAGVDIGAPAAAEPVIAAEAPVTESALPGEIPITEPALPADMPVTASAGSIARTEPLLPTSRKDEPLLTAPGDRPALLGGPTVVTPELSAQELDQEEHIEARQ
jgi:hypothetical protein